MGKAISIANFEGRQEEDDITCTEQVEKFRAAVRYLKMSMDLQLELNGYFAFILHAKYVALVEAGFNEEQALMLCR